ncbi:ABC transporter permease [Halobacteriales archaeon SW_6_65_46]|nr:MAG: ABC transporter permease [Halobacteriales archaeon SW_6_65_46]
MIPWTRLFGRVPSLLIARRNVTRAKVRSGLAIAAIVIGVVAIGAIGAGGAAFKQSQLATLDDQGATNVFVLPGIDRDERTFDRTDVQRIEERVAPAGVLATRSGGGELRTREGTEPVSLTYLATPRLVYDVRAGSIPTNWRRGALLSAGVADEYGLEPGDRVHLTRDGETSVVRVEAVVTGGGGVGGPSVLLPLELTGERRFSQLRVTTQSVERAESAAATLREEFNGRTDTLLVFELTSLVRLFRSIVNGINLFLAGLAAISLLVAGVSIASTMLMAIIRRRQEIGVLRAVGYGRRDIVRILLAEAALLGLIGTAIGLTLALLVTMAANALFLGGPLAFAGESLLYLAAAALFGIGVSLVAGVYPAWRAANDRPVEALRG